MVDEFSAFARMPVPVYKKANLTNLVKELGSISLLSNEFINVEIKTPKKNIIAVIDENQIRQALQTNHPSGAVKEKAKLDKLISRLKHHAK